jgi:hypothetical protein
MTNTTAEGFFWFVPDHGYELLYVGRPQVGQAVVYEPGSVFMRPAPRRRRTLQPLDPAEVNRSLRASLEAGATARPQSRLRGFALTPEGEDVPGKLYAPLWRGRNLFETFAQATPDAHGFLSFANEHGNVADDCSLAHWHQDVLAMRQAIHIWGLYKNRDARSLLKHFDFTEIEEKDLYMTGGPPGVYVGYTSHPGLPHNQQPPFPDKRTDDGLMIPDFDRVRWYREQFKKHGHAVGPYHSYDVGYLPLPPRLTGRKEKDVLTCAKLYLLKVIDERSEQETTSRFTLAEVEAEARGPHRKRRKRRKPPAWEVPVSRETVPRNLLGAIWMQFEQAVLGNKEFRRCLECGEQFEVSLQAARADKKRCSDACRAKAYRRGRKKRARKE